MFSVHTTKVLLVFSLVVIYLLFSPLAAYSSVLKKEAADIVEMLVSLTSHAVPRPTILFILSPYTFDTWPGIAQSA